MVDISSVGKNLNLDTAVAAGAAQTAGVAGQSKVARKRPLAQTKGLGLEDIPEDATYVPVQDAAVQEGVAVAEEPAAEAVAAYTEEENDQMLAKIDYVLATVQTLLKKALSKKIALADKNADFRHQLLLSSFEDCKHLHGKIREVRDYLV